AVGKVEIGGDVVPGPALENDVLDAIAIALDRADDLGIERGLVGKATELFHELLAQALLVGEDVALVLQAFEGEPSLLDGLAGQVAQVASRHLLRWPTLEGIGKDVQLLCERSRTGDEKDEATKPGLSESHRRLQ